MAKKQSDSIIETIQNNYVSALIGLIIVILGIGYIYNSIKTRNAAVDNQANQEEMESETDQQGTISGRTYKVQAGDTLWSIAERKYQSGHNYVDIVEANKLPSENSIEVGQTLTLPDVPAKKATVGSVAPTVKPAPTATIAPTATTAPRPTAMTPTRAMQGETQKAPITINGNNYTIQKGDHLWGIAVRAYGDGYKWVDIYNANKKTISNPNLIYAGNKLVLPR